MKIDITEEITLKTARSGGKGGQNVNKLETMVEGRWSIAESRLLTDAEKAIVAEKLATKLVGNGILLVKSQQARTQIENKYLVYARMNGLVNEALVPKKLRIATQIPTSVIEKRKKLKKNIANKKADRKNIDIINI